MSRKDAQRRINGLAPKIEEHLAKIAAQPNSRDLPHWRSEVSSWIGQVEAVLPYVGAKTSNVWKAGIADWRSKLGN